MLHGGRALRHAAGLTPLRSDCRARVFDLDHLVPTERRMVVTMAELDQDGAPLAILACGHIIRAELPINAAMPIRDYLLHR
ncbi:MAG: hypothetical protein GW948_02740 [Rhodobacterales bacterium]|nr:hypothetical protein [Rhodobacterales bacterium]